MDGVSECQGKEKNPRPDFFLPDFDIYIEHWAVDKNGDVPSWFGGTDASKKYLATMNLKKMRFSVQTRILSSKHSIGNSLRMISRILPENNASFLKKKFPDKEFTIEELPYDEIVEKVWKDCKASIDDFSKNWAHFIVIAKTYHLMPSDITARLSNEPWTKRQKAFASVAIKIFERYEVDLRSKNCIDFSDMINLAIHELTTKRICSKMFLITSSLMNIRISVPSDRSDQSTYGRKMRDANCFVLGMTGRAFMVFPDPTWTSL